MMSQDSEGTPRNPLNLDEHLKVTVSDSPTVPPAHTLLADEHDSAVTKAEKFESSGLAESHHGQEPPPSKRVKLDLDPPFSETTAIPVERVKGIAPIKAEFLVYPPGSSNAPLSASASHDTSESNRALIAKDDRRSSATSSRKKEKSKGQNTGRHFGFSRDEVGLCQSRATYPEFSPGECRFGDSCKFEHVLRKYLRDWKREDLTTFDGICPIWSLKRHCQSGWKCRFVGSHMEERELADGRKELLLLDIVGENSTITPSNEDDNDIEVVNIVPTSAKVDLMKRRIKTPKADSYLAWLEKGSKELENQAKERADKYDASEIASSALVQDLRAQYIEPPFLPSEKRRVYFGPETPTLAPLTTQGNLPFRRLCVELGAQITYSEMAMSLPLLQGQKSEWALMKAHELETKPPRYSSNCPVVKEYDNSRDSKFGAQISANKPWQALKATEVLTQLCPHIRVIDLNCGCPIDLVYRQGAGSALLESPSKLEKILRGMNAVSGEVPITAKIRMGTKDSKPTAQRLLDRLAHGGDRTLDDGGGTSGVAAITLHGRSRQQRYTKNADWTYISECADLIQKSNDGGDRIVDTVREADARYQPAGGKIYFLGNGDCFSHVDYNTHIEHAKVDSVMVARGALIKPWIFEEIEKGQYIDKSANERLALIERFARYGLQTWGSDEIGIGTTRRFLLEWLSFTYRYVPIGILEHLPPSLQDRPPAWKGRNELETLLGSDDYKDWIKISEMFLGPAHPNFKFEPKHKSNSYEIEAEG